MPPLPNHRLVPKPSVRKSARKFVPLLVGAAVVASTAGVSLELQQDASRKQAATANTYGIFSDSLRPKVTSAQDRARVTLGMTFSSNTSGRIKGVQFYRGGGDSGRHVAKLWTSSGRLLATASFAKRTSTGWQTAYFKKPVKITRSTRYVAGYTAPHGRYADDQHALSSSKRSSNRALTAYSGVYTYAKGMPRSTWRDSNYYVDVVFSPSAVSSVAELHTSPSSSPTTTPSTTPPTSPAPSTGAFPNGSNTGVPAGVSLSDYSGPMTIKTNGTVIDGKSIVGDLRIQAKNVVVKNSVIKGDVRIDSEDTGYSFAISDSNIYAGRALGQDAFDGTGIGARDFTATGVNVQGGKRSINCFTNCTIRDSYVHDQTTDNTGVEHESAIRMGSNSTLVHNTLLCNAPDVAPEAGCSGDLTGYGDFAPVKNNLIQNNLFKATTGATCAYGGSSGGKPFSASASNIRFIDNVFERGNRKSDHGTYICGYYATVLDFNKSAPGNVFTGNKFDDGAAVSAG